MKGEVGHARWVYLAILTSGLALGGADRVEAQSSGAGGLEATPPSNVRFHNAVHMAKYVRRAVEGAARRLADPGCQQVLTDFTDLSGRSLQTNLDVLGLPADEYLGLVMFYEASPKRCRRSGATMLTAPGSRVVYVCPGRLQRIQQRKPAEAEALIIHEMLHSLGLGENPPSAEEITNRVKRRCGR